MNLLVLVAICVLGDRREIRRTREARHSTPRGVVSIISHFLRLCAHMHVKQAFVEIAARREVVEALE